MTDLFDAEANDPAAEARLRAAGWRRRPYYGLPHWVSPEGSVFQYTSDALREQDRREGKEPR